MQGAVAVEFNADFLRGLDANAIDLKRFALGNPVLPGVYRAETYFNGTWLGRLDVELTPGSDSNRAEVCIDRVMARRLYLDLAKMPERVQDFLKNTAAGKDAPSGPKCLRATDISPQATAVFDPSEQRLDLSVPQALVTRVARGYVPPEAWEEGVRALGVDYQLSSYRQSNSNAKSPASDSNFLGLTARVNVGGGWQLTHVGNLAWGTSQDRKYTSIGTYARHDIPAWRSSLTLGDDYTDGQLFDSVRFKGVKVASDDRMLPDSQRGYAPVIRGQARGNAKVTVQQNGQVLTEIVVPPGPFEINDMYATGFGGDLLVTVTESDGSQQSFTVAYAAGPLLLREGQIRHSVVVGELNNSSLSTQPGFGQATLQYGLNNTVTGNVGLMGMKGYQAALLGGAFSTAAGAFSLNASVSQLSVPNASTLTGNSYSASYAFVLPSTRTNVAFAAYRYNTENYYSISDAAAVLAGTQYAYRNKLRERNVVSLNQVLSSRTSIYLIGSDQTYWDVAGHTQSYQLNFNYRFKDVTLSVGAGRTLAGAGGTSDSTFNIGLNFPIGKEGRTTNVNTNYLHSDVAGDTSQVNASGAFGEESQYGYGVSAIQSKNAQSNVALNGSWRTSVGNLGVSTSQSQGQSQDSLSFSGGLVVHGGGLTLAPAVGETYAIVNAKEAAGAIIQNGSMTAVNSSGYAVVPYLMPYQTNTIDLDLRKVSLDVELESTSAQVAPHAGSAVAVTFNGRRGRAALLTLTLDDGNTIPLGATVVNENKEAIGMVGQGGLADIRVNSDKGSLRVSWGDGPAQSCQFDYALKPREVGEQFAKQQAICRLPLRDMQRAGEPANVSQETGDAANSKAQELQKI